MASGRSTREERQAKVAQMRAEAAKAEARRRTLIVTSIVAVIVVAIVAGFVIVQQARRDSAAAESATPANIGADNSIVIGDDDAPVTMVVYEDFQCPYCAQFESANREQMADWTDSGDVQVQYRPIAFLDSASTDDYSTRALNAVAAVMDVAPDAFLEFHNLLFENQPEEGGAGLTDQQLIDYAVQAGAPEEEITEPIENLAFEGWTARVTEASSQDGISGTPTIKINGTSIDNIDADSVKSAVEDALAAAE